MPSYNSAQTISASIESVIDQSDANWELLITDDGSSDSSYAIASEYSKVDERIRVFRHSSSRGAAAARNRSISEARGRFIAFLDSDDLWRRDKLDTQVPFTLLNGAALTYTAYYKIPFDYDETAQGWRSRVVPVPSSLTYRRLLRHCYIGCLTALYDRDSLGTIYMPDIRMRQDYGLWLTIARTGGKLLGICEPLAMYRTNSPNSLSHKRLSATRYTWQVYRQHEALSRVQSLACLSSHLVRAARKSVI
jgi:glycosyltransferase involved in cell wall biosynthesis